MHTNGIIILMKKNYKWYRIYNKKIEKENREHSFTEILVSLRRQFPTTTPYKCFALNINIFIIEPRPTILIQKIYDTDITWT